MYLSVKNVGGEMLFYERFKDSQELIDAFRSEQSLHILNDLSAEQAYHLVLEAYYRSDVESLRDLAIVLIMNRGAWIEVV